MLTRAKVSSLTIAVFLVLTLVPDAPTTPAPLSVNPAHPLFSTADSNAGWEEVGPGSATGGGISDNSGDSWGPSADIAPDGTPYIAWNDDSSGDFEIYVRRWNGSSWEEVGLGSASGGGISNNSGDSYHPSMAIAPDGTSYVAWYDYSGGDTEIYVRRWNGSSWEEVEAGSASGGGISDNSGESWFPSMAIAPGGTPYVAWHDRTGGFGEIYVKRWNGNSWKEVGAGSASGGGISNNSGYSDAPSMAIAPDGTPYITWYDGSGGNHEIYVKHWNGTSWEEVGPGSATGGGISDNSGVSVYPSVAIAPDGTPYVAWRDYSGGYYPEISEIYVRRWNGSNWEEVGLGSAAGGGISDNSSESFGASVAIAPDGTPYIAWNDDSSGDFEIYVRWWNGSDWENVGLGSATGGGISDNSGGSAGASLAVAPEGTLYIAWNDNSGGDNFEIYMRRWAVDLSISAVTPIQVLEGQPLVLDKITAVRVVVNKSGSGSVNNVQVRLTYGAEELTSFYVSEPGNWDNRFRLQQDNTAYPLNFSASETSKTIYFFSDALVPTAAGSYNVVAEVDPLNLIPETDETHNTGSADGVTAYEAKWGPWPFSSLRLRYIPVEQPRSQAVIHYAETGTDFIGATYPVVASNLQDGVSALSFFRLYQEPNEFGLRMALVQLLFMGKAADPTADRIIGIAPAGWLHNNYPFVPEGATGYGVWPTAAAFVEMAGISTTAHEVGHSYGLWIGCEEYDADCDDTPDNLGNTVHGGLRVSDRTVMNDGDTKDTTRHGVYCFMGTANYDPPTIDRFVDAQDYQALAAQSGVTGQAMSNLKAEEGIVLVMGIIGKDNSAEFLDWYRLPEGAADATEPGPYVLTALDGAGEVLYEQPFTMTFTTVGAITPTLEEAPFAFAMPFISGTTDFELQHEGQTLITRTVSAHAPTVTVLSPNGGEVLTGSGTVEWTADDADADTLSYAVLLSTDNGTTWSTAALGMTTTLHSLNVSALPPGTGNLVKVIATDGVNTGQDESDAPFTIISNVYIPIILKDY